MFVPIAFLGLAQYAGTKLVLVLSPGRFFRHDSWSTVNEGIGMIGKRCVRVVVAFLLGPILLTNGCVDKKLTDIEYLQKAKALYERSELKAADIELKNALKINPKNAEARWLLGKLYIALSDGSAAQIELDKALKDGVPRNALLLDLVTAKYLQSDFKGMLDMIEISESISSRDKARLLALRGEALLATKRREQAGQDFQAALVSDPSSTEAQVGQARALLYENRLDEARTKLTQITSVDPKSPEAWLLLGNIAGASGDLSDAEKHYSAAIESSYVNIKARIDRAIVRARLKDFAKAEEDLKIIKRAQGRYPRGLYAEGVVRFLQGNHAEAQAILHKNLEAMPNYAPALYFLGATQFSVGQFAQADETLSRLVKTYQHHLPAVELLSAVRLRSGDVDSVIKMLKAFADEAPLTPMSARLLGEAYLVKGLDAQAAQYLNMAVDSQQNTPDFDAQVGLSLLRAGETDKAFTVLRESVDADKSNKRHRLALMLALVDAEKYEEAEGRARKLLKDEPSNSLADFIMGMIAQKKGDVVAAKASYKQAMSKNPGDSLAGLRLATLHVQGGRVAEARPVYLEILKQNPNHLIALQELARVEVLQGDQNAARELLERAVESNPTALAPRVLLARYFLGSAQSTKALSLLEPMSETHSSNVELVELLSETFMSLGQVAQAESLLRRFVTGHPQSANVRYLLGQALVAVGRLTEAEAEFNYVKKIDENHLQARISLVRLSALHKKQRVARNMLVDLQKKFSANPEVVALEGWLYMVESKPVQAVEAFKRAKKSANSPKLTVDLARMQWESKDWAGGIRTLEEWLVGKPNDLGVRYELGVFQMAQNHSKEAILAFEAILKVTPRHAPALNNLAWLLIDSDAERAFKYVQEANVIAPNNIAVLDTMGLIELKRGNNAEALAIFKKFVEKETAVSLRYHYAMALAANNKTEDAKKILRDVLSGGSLFPEIGGAKALLEKIGG